MKVDEIIDEWVHLRDQVRRLILANPPDMHEDLLRLLDESERRLEPTIANPVVAEWITLRTQLRRCGVNGNTFVDREPIQAIINAHLRSPTAAVQELVGRLRILLLVSADGPVPTAALRVLLHETKDRHVE